MYRPLPELEHHTENPARHVSPGVAQEGTGARPDPGPLPSRSEGFSTCFLADRWSRPTAVHRGSSPAASLALRSPFSLPYAICSCPAGFLFSTTLAIFSSLLGAPPPPAPADLRTRVARYVAPGLELPSLLMSALCTGCSRPPPRSSRPVSSPPCTRSCPSLAARCSIHCPPVIASMAAVLVRGFPGCLARVVSLLSSFWVPLCGRYLTGQSSTRYQV